MNRLLMKQNGLGAQRNAEHGVQCPARRSSKICVEGMFFSNRWCARILK
jgi:hypothetical protein